MLHKFPFTNVSTYCNRGISRFLLAAGALCLVAMLGLTVQVPAKAIQNGCANGNTYVSGTVYGAWGSCRDGVLLPDGSRGCGKGRLVYQGCSITVETQACETIPGPGGSPWGSPGTPVGVSQGGSSPAQ
jgi:hypothetical protein